MAEQNFKKNQSVFYIDFDGVKHVGKVVGRGREHGMRVWDVELVNGHVVWDMTIR